MLTCSEQLRREQASNHWPGGSEHPNQHTLFRGNRWQPLHPGLRLLGQELPCLLHRNWWVCVSITTERLTFNLILGCHVHDVHLRNRKTHPDSVWPLGCGDLSGQVRVLYRRRLLHRVWLQRCDSSSVVLEWKAPHHRGQPQQQWVCGECGEIIWMFLLVYVVCCNFVVSSRWLSCAQSCADRTWPRGGVCVCVCRVRVGDQWS